MPTLIRTDGPAEFPDQLPVVALRDLVFFPYMVLPLLIGRPQSTAALREAEASPDRLLLLLTQRDPERDEAGEEDVFRVGTVARVVQVTPLPDGTCRVVLEGMGRATVERFLPSEDGALQARVQPFSSEAETGTATAELEAVGRGVIRLFEEYARLNESVPDDLPRLANEIRDRVRLIHLVAGHLLVPSLDKQPVLEAADPALALALLQKLLAWELEILRIEEKLDQQIRLQLDSDRKQFYLNEQLKAIHRELGEGDAEEWQELESLLRTRELPPQARERVDRELGRLRKLNPVAPEAAVIRTYVDWILALPWTARSTDSADVSRALQVLDEAHFGLSEVKDRILDHIAVLSLVGELKGPILCLAGPPGVGKTSLGRSIARALGREFVRVSLGGVRDEAEIRGHRRTYVGALPGRILQGMRRSGTRNPVFLLDEVDKLARDFHGDPGAALLEVLDPEQNRSFTDHYLELEFDLSDTLFVTTANTLQGIPEPLRDRMEVIRLPGYLDTEKRTIARRFLWPRQAARHGIEPNAVTLDDKGLDSIIHLYTREAGVRELDRRVGRITRKLARQVAEGVPHSPRLGVEQVRALLGPPAYLPADQEDELDRSGIARGLAWTTAGGEVLDVEVAVVPGVGDVRLTGTLGDVMKESALAAVTYARSRARRLGLDPRFHREIDIHIHLPEGATPKDGPSAGITIAVALISALTDTPTSADVAMTGEITLRGRVLAVGGVKEKAVAALRSGVKRVILPAANVPELELLPEEVRMGIEFVPVNVMDDVLLASLATVPAPRMTEGVQDTLSGGAELRLYILKTASLVEIRAAEYAGTVATPTQAPPGELPEVAFSGRSNVGKSSLINILLRRSRKKIAHVSSTPGKTRALNFYRVNDRFFLVDLPGFGYARVPQPVRGEWRELIEGYLSHSPRLRGVVHLVDVRHSPTELDRHMMEYLSEVGVPALVVATKMDKLKKSQRDRHLARVQEDLAIDTQQLLPFSSHTGEGRDALLLALDSLLGYEESEDA